MSVANSFGKILVSHHDDPKTVPYHDCELTAGHYSSQQKASFSATSPFGFLGYRCVPMALFFLFQM